MLNRCARGPLRSGFPTRLLENFLSSPVKSARPCFCFLSTFFWSAPSAQWPCVVFVFLLLLLLVCVCVFFVFFCLSFSVVCFCGGGGARLTKAMLDIYNQVIGVPIPQAWDLSKSLSDRPIRRSESVSITTWFFPTHFCDTSWNLPSLYGGKGSLWEALLVVSQKWVSFPTALVRFDGPMRSSRMRGVAKRLEGEQLAR